MPKSSAFSRAFHPLAVPFGLLQPSVPLTGPSRSPAHAVMIRALRSLIRNVRCITCGKRPEG